MDPRRLPWLPLIALALTQLGACAHPDHQRIRIAVAASHEGGSEVAVMEAWVWHPRPACDEIVFQDNEIWIGWSHENRGQELGDVFLAAERAPLDRPYLTVSDDGRLVYYSFGTYAEVTDRNGYQVLTIDEAMGSAAFFTGTDMAVIEGPDAFRYVRLQDRSWTELSAVGSDPSFSPDGEWITYGREGRVYVYDLVGDAEHGMGDGLRPRYQADGRVMAQRDGEQGPGLYAVEPGHGGWTWAGEADTATLDADWWRLAPDGERILVDTGSGGYTLRSWTGAAPGDWQYDGELFCE